MVLPNGDVDYGIMVVSRRRKGREREEEKMGWEGRIKKRKRRESHHPSGEPQRKNVARGHNKRGPRS